MFIQPNSDLKLYSGIPLDNTYVHTLYFPSLTEQNNYFHVTANVVKQWFDFSYIRVNKSVIRVPIKADYIYNCNYLAFRNSSFGDKWFYAFVTSVEYISNDVSEITFEIDVMQTWFVNDVTLMDSFVEREHSVTDNVGDNIVNENFNIGEYYNDTIKFTNLFNEYTIVMVLPYKWVGSQPVRDYHTHIINGTPYAINAYYYGGTLTQALIYCQVDLFSLEEYGFADDVTALYCVPRALLPTVENGRYELPSSIEPRSITYAESKPTSLGSYVPINKKLLTNPFNYFTIETFGENNDYAYEFFSSDDISFNIHSNLTTNTSFKATPKYYKGVYDNISEGVTMSDFPMVAYTINEYKESIVKNKTKLGVQGLSLLGNFALGAIHPITAVNSTKNLLEGVGGMIANASSNRTIGSKGFGSTDGSLEVSMGIKDFNYIHKYLNPKDAKMIDDFFTMFGYKTCSVKRPNISSRPRWNYVKTIGCNIEGNAPADDVKKICNIFDSGITFWKNYSEVGDYSGDNSPSN